MQLTTDPNEPGIPDGSQSIRLRFAKETGGDRASYMLLDETDGRRAEELERVPLTDMRWIEELDADGQDFVLISVPAPIEEQAPLALALRHGLERRSDLAERKVTLFSLQGAHMVHAPGWIAVIAVPERLELACRSALEVAFHERELRAIEHALNSGWGALRAAAPLAFEATPALLERRPELVQAFLELVDWRGRYARLGPRIMVPQIYPPTLSSQVGERVRERMKMLERYELVEGYLAAQEQIYAMCSERVSEFTNARRGHTLEWVIIAILGAQTLLWLIESLSNAAVTTT